MLLCKGLVALGISGIPNLIAGRDKARVILISKSSLLNMNRKIDGRQVTKEGWLMKEGGAARNKWQNRWFRLQGKTINYYLKKEDSNPQGIIHLDDVKDVSRIGEHSGKAHCMVMVTTKDKGRKVYYLAAENEANLNDWFIALNANLSPDVPMKLLKYCTAEVFLSQGVRITGDVNYEILSFISHRVPVEKKKRDNFGWFCDRPIAVGTVLNLFADYGWSPERVYRSTALSGTEANVVLPVVRILFCKSPVNPACKSRTESKSSISSFSRSLPHSSLNRMESSGKFFGAIRGAAGKLGELRGIGKSEENSLIPVTPPPIPPESTFLDGADDELIMLMHEFNIPLSLLEIN